MLNVTLVCICLAFVVKTKELLKTLLAFLQRRKLVCLIGVFDHFVFLQFIRELFSFGVLVCCDFFFE
jgi:hypothetical protein